jgi:hypothetical protein
MLSRRTFTGRWGVVFAIWAGVAGATSVVAAQSTALEGVLVLDNGNVLAGAIERVGDQYVINVTGATLQVPVAQVERFAPTVEEAYEQRRVTLVDGTADRHLELAAWCLHLKLFDQAARELLDARRVDAQIPGLEALERQLRHRLDLEASRPTASHRSAAPLAQADHREGETAPPMPAISVEAQAQFVRSIQPMLIRNCSTAGCHQTSADHGMQLDRWALEGRGSAEIVRKNLSAVLAEVNIENLGTSELLAKARAKHGQGTAGGSRPLSAHQLNLLTDWLNHSFGVPPAVATLPVATADVGAENVGFIDAGIDFDPNVMPAAFTPRDAFDPEILNRRRASREAAEAVDAEVGVDALNAVELSSKEEPSEALSSPSQSPQP